MNVRAPIHAARIANAKPPSEPSAVLRGEIAAHGRVRPSQRPIAYAPVSQLQVTRNA